MATLRDYFDIENNHCFTIYKDMPLRSPEGEMH